MTKSRLRLVIGISALLITLIGGGIVYMVHQHQVKEAEEHQKMVAIATSEEAKKVYEDKLKREDPKAFTNEGVIQSYKIDETSLKHNPMGGLMVTILINDDKKLSLDFNLIDNGDGTYHSAYFSISPKLGDLLGY